MPVSRNSSRRRSPHDVLHQPLPMDDLVINTRSPFDRPKRWKKFFKYALALILVVAAVSVSLHALRPDSKETDVATASNVAASINGSIDKGDDDPKRKVLEEFQPFSTQVSFSSLSIIASLSKLNIDGPILSSFLVERIVGTLSHKYVQTIIINFFRQMNWSVEEDRFTEQTPHGPKEFNNIIVTKHGHVQDRLILAAHYDSKIFPGQEFIAATDSAVPCGLLLDLAQVLNPYLEILQNPSVTLQMVFFDGEEAFVDWTETDSLYGSRHLAAKWEKENKLKSIKLLVLLDLLGSGGSMHLLHSSGLLGFTKLVEAESRLRQLQLIKRVTGEKTQLGDTTSHFHNPKIRMVRENAIDDDHRPFFQRNVPILHLIPYPFPAVWHNIQDDRAHLNQNDIDDLALIFRVWLLEYFGVSAFNTEL